MTRAILLALSVTAISACANTETAIVDNPGQVTVQGLTPAAALGAVDTQTVAEASQVTNGGDNPATSGAAPEEGAIRVEGVQASAVLSAVDTGKLIGPDAKPDPTAPADDN